MLSVIATDLPRILACNGSVKIEHFVSSLETDDSDKKLGIAAHWLIEQVHKNLIPAGMAIEGMQAPNGVFITADMIENVTPYLNDIQGVGQVEFDTSYQDVTGRWRIGSRADHIFQGNGTLVIRDFKYGWRIVEPELNYTLIWHAIGFLLRAKSMGITYTGQQLSVIEFWVYQPRPYHAKGNIRKWTIPRGTLEDIWARTEAILENSSDQLNTGSHCYKCPAMVNCPAYQKATNCALEASEQAFTDTIDNKNLSVQLDITTRAMEILKQACAAYEELAKHRVKQGQIIPNYAVEPSVGKREWNDGITPEFMKIMTGKDLSKKELITPAQAKKLGVPETVVESFSKRDTKGFNLVRADTDSVAKKMFKSNRGE